MATLSEFIARAMAFFDKAEANAKPTDEQAKRIAELEKTVAEQKTTIEARDKSITDLQANLDKTTGEVAAKEKEITDLKAKLDAETKRTETTLAAAGVDPSKIPAEKPGEQKAAGGTGILEQLNAITDSRERVEFYRKNREAIDKAYQGK